MPAPQSSQAFVIPGILPSCPLFPPQHFAVLLSTSVGYTELGTELSLPLGHPLLLLKTSAPPVSQICFSWKKPGSDSALQRICPAIMHVELGL